EVGVSRVRMLLGMPGLCDGCSRPGANSGVSGCRPRIRTSRAPACQALLSACLRAGGPQGEGENEHREVFVPGRE
ncbi:MAG: hypothetical protein ACE5F1_22260, partial [Planctomycetota bacterium]